MTLIQLPMALLSRTASRALMSGLAPMAVEAPSAWSAAGRQACQVADGLSRAHVPGDAGPSTSSTIVSSAERQRSTSNFHRLCRTDGGVLNVVVAACPASWSASPLPSATVHQPSSLLLLRSLQTSQSTLAADGSDGSSASSSPPGSSNMGSTGAPVSNPLQAALQQAADVSAGVSGTGEAASGGAHGGLTATMARAALTRGRRARNWMWYDEKDEREERRKESARQQYTDAGTCYLMDIPQSMKKMNRFAKLIRGLSYNEAVSQCHMFPHKATRYVLKALEKAYEDATTVKGLQGDKLIVGTIFVTKGLYEKGMQPMGKGASGRLVTRKSHLRIALYEAPPEAPVGSFFARQVPPLMSAWRGPAPWLLAGASRPQTRKAFAYKTEV